MRSWLLTLSVLVGFPAAESPPALTTVVGTSRAGYAGDGGPARQALLNNPFDVAFDHAGNLFLSDTFNHCVRRVDVKTGIITTVAGDGTKGDSGDGGPATRARMNEPYGIALDRAGNLFIADRLNRRVRRVDAKTGIMTTCAGNGTRTYSGDGGQATRAGLVEPNGVALDPQERRLFIADVSDNRIRVVELESGVITTFAGTGQARHTGDGGPARDAAIFGARAVEVGADGTVYILERQGNTLRAVVPTSGKIATIAGTGAKGHAGDGGSALSATFNGPKEMALDPAGNIFIVDTENQAIRRIDARSHLVTTVAGSGRRGGLGDAGPATAAQLARPHGVAIAKDGSLLIGDTENHRIRMVSGR